MNSAKIKIQMFLHVTEITTSDVRHFLRFFKSDLRMVRICLRLRRIEAGERSCSRCQRIRGKVGQETYDMISYLFELRTSVQAKMDRYRHAALDLET